MGAVGREGGCRTCSAELFLKLAVGPLPALQLLCPPDLVLQRWRSLRALGFMGRLGTTGLGVHRSSQVVRRKGPCWTWWDGSAGNGAGWLAGPWRGQKQPKELV